ncbi:MAG: hypothetical protein IJV62_02530, partial [Eggerthellaceae bacterium]|nr:hypothetical protein [Eggerthellaceae bacterium]
MFEHDYIMRQFLQLFRAIERISQRQKPGHTMSAKERAQALDDAIGEILGMNGAVVLRLAPESFASIVKVSDIDPRIGEYMVQTLVLAHYYFSLAGDDRTAHMRRAQADE